MAVAGIIGGAIGVMLLIITAYMLVNSVIFTAGTVINAQKDMTLLTEARTGTDFSILSNPICTWKDSNYNITFDISNTGTKTISDFKHMSVIIKDSEGYYFYPYKQDASTAGYWKISKYNNDVMHPGQLDPGEIFEVTLLDPDYPNWIQMTTGNGEYDSEYTGVCADMLPAPTFTSITPSSSPTGTPVIIVGTNFVDGGSFGVTIGGKAATDVDLVNATHITAKTPVGTGTVDVVIKNIDGQTAIGPGAYTYT